MIRKITLAVLAVYILVIGIFCFFGVQIRRAVAPVVETEYLEYGSNYYCYIVPSDAVNNNSVFVADMCFDYPEPSFTARLIEVQIISENGGYTEVMSYDLNYESLIILNPENLKDGQYINVE